MVSAFVALSPPPCFRPSEEIFIQYFLKGFLKELLKEKPAAGAENFGVFLVFGLRKPSF